MEESISHSLKVLNNQISRDINTFALQFKLTGTQIQILDFLNGFTANKNVFQKDVEKEFNIRRSTATNILKNMEEKDLIKRTALPSDSRLKIIEVQKSGQDIQREISKFLKETDNSILNKLGAFERRSFIKSLHKISNNLEDAK
ncbi:transcriptional regulator [Companilactobacillus sp. RD055328]|uniref:MarR family winged helix-turn-helix transcriptional regulator n=1 Tax=Companilactobacillus sp. RD055328 TaxID=2916634 RepID=UPI001FC81A90|nr:MarR family winged helix-turn-helix transcriptional regulator [Companilactobacillus sp. RD055328]GKQ43321.1 transcriptional regulator [Companilactobacillus sp. RD055328]